MMNKPKPSIYLEAKEEVELMAFLVAQFPKSRTNIKSLLQNKQVWVDGRAVSQYNYRLLTNQKIEIRTNKVHREPTYHGLTILFEDAHLIVIDKQAGLLSMATDKKDEQTAYRLLSLHVKQQNPSNKVFIVHRLDRDTSGVMVFAKSEKIQQLLQVSWEPTTKERTYLAVVEGVLGEPNGTVISYLKESKALTVYSSLNPNQGQRAVTHYKTLKANAQYSMLEVKLETGRKNQIRVHCQDLGHPIVGDKKYGSSLNPMGRLGLHAYILGFVHPITNEKLRFETKVPPSFLSLFKN
ncbi:MAG: RluA family pseudouridine synthase [Spirosomataceae bacterium]